AAWTEGPGTRTGVLVQGRGRGRGLAYLTRPGGPRGCRAPWRADGRGPDQKPTAGRQRAQAGPLLADHELRACAGEPGADRADQAALRLPNVGPQSSPFKGSACEAGGGLMPRRPVR